MTGWILLIVIVVVLAGLGSLYNRLVQLRNRVRNAWAQIDVQLKRRHDLIPNVLETVKGYMQHEQETLEDITRLRAEAGQASGAQAVGEAESKLAGALGKLMLVVENYPELKASENFLALQQELSSTEDQVGLARQMYNDSVMTYNTRIESVPANIIAGTFGFSPEDFFEVTTREERAAPTVDFGASK